jgi:hypothetical protein
VYLELVPYLSLESAGKNRLRLILVLLAAENATVKKSFKIARGWRLNR